MTDRVKALSKALPHRLIGVKLALKENMTENQHNRRMAGLFKTWSHWNKKRRGEYMPMKKKHSRRLPQAEILEARQVQELSRMAAKDVVDMYIKMVKGEDKTARAADRIAAGKELMERGYGKSISTHTNVHVDANGKLNEVSRKELITRVEESLKTVEGLTSRAKEKRDRKEPSADVRQRDGDPGGSTVH